MSTHVFGKEVALLERSRNLVAAGSFDDEAVSTILDGYEKLLRESRRLVRFSDRSEMNLRSAHSTIAAQKAGLEDAHALVGPR